MRKQVKPGEVYWSFDGTHGTNNHNYALITANTYDMQRQAFPVAFAICNAERETNMTWVGEKLQEEIAKHSAEVHYGHHDVARGLIFPYYKKPIWFNKYFFLLVLVQTLIYYI